MPTKISFQYAYNTAYIAESVEQIERVLERLRAWYAENSISLSIEPEKTAIFPALNWKKKATLATWKELKYEEKVIPLVTGYKHLGRIFKSSWRANLDRAHFRHMQIKAQITYSVLTYVAKRYAYIPSRVIVSYLKAIFLPIIEYGMETYSREE